jgi:hypothetical protein
MRVRRSGSKRGAWHKRERKRLPAELRPVAPPPPPPPLERLPTEEQWLSNDPRRMTRCVVRLATDSRVVFHMTAPQVARKLRLYYCACARNRWDLLTEELRAVVCVLEAHADGIGNGRTLRAARATARAAQQALRTAWSVEGSAAPDAWYPYYAAAAVVSAAEVREQLQAWGSGYASWPGLFEQAELLRDLFDNPFHPTEVEARWLTSDVVRLARLIRAERSYELMPFLGDALQDAGCASAAVLGHCYDPHSHTPGCWLVDALTA